MASSASKEFDGFEGGYPSARVTEHRLANCPNRLYRLEPGRRRQAGDGELSENRLELFVGVVVLVVAGFFLAYLLQDETLPGSSGYGVSASFTSAQGVAVGTDIRMAGVRIGSVSAINLDQENFVADLELSFNEGIMIPEDSSATIVSEGLLGGFCVEIVPGGSFDYLQEGDQIIDTQGHVGLVQLLTNFFFSVQ